MALVAGVAASSHQHRLWESSDGFLAYMRLFMYSRVASTSPPTRTAIPMDLFSDQSHRRLVNSLAYRDLVLVSQRGFTEKMNLKKCIHYIEELMIEEGTFDGLMCFSQVDVHGIPFLPDADGRLPPPPSP